MAESPGNMLDQDLNCLECGYNLRGLPEDGQCPECGTRVFFSVIAANGNAIGNPHWARRTAAGARLYAIALLSALLLTTAGMVLQRLHFQTIFESLLCFVFAAGTSAGAVAIWWSTTPCLCRDGERPLSAWCATLRFTSAIAAVSASAFCALTMWESLSGSIAGFGLLITDALYLMYLARLVRHLPGNLADWGYATAGHFVLVFLAGCLLPSISRSGPPVLELDRETIIVCVLMPACAFLWPAVYAWVWSRRVSRLAGR